MIINPNIRPGGGLADPHAFVEDGRVYLFCGHDESPKTEDTWRMDKWCLFSSDNLIDWQQEGEILPTDTYIGHAPNCWAGYITKKGENYYWYFSNKNKDTGVLVAESITGPFVDQLGGPVIPEGIAQTKSYDPCVYEENGTYTIFFGAGQYYCATLSKDMMHLEGEPEPIRVYDENGREIRTSDKSTVFKYKGHYYLAYGNRYAMSDCLKGPYQYKGHFVGGGHNDVFEFKGKMYVCNEFHDTNIFFRGVRVMELLFNEDGTVKLADDDEGDTKESKVWDFTKKGQHWFLTDGTDASYSNQGLRYILNKKVGVQSPLWPGVLIPSERTLIIQMDNQSTAQTMQVTVITMPEKPGYWSSEAHYEKTYVLPIQKGKGSYNVTLPLEEGYPTFIKRLSIGVAEQQVEGTWVIEQITCRE